MECDEIVVRDDMEKEVGDQGGRAGRKLPKFSAEAIGGERVTI